VNALKTEVAALNSTRAETRAQSEQFNKAAADYFAKWDETIKGMSEPTAAAGQKRMALAKSSLDDLQRQANDVRARVAPFMVSLNEATKYLGTDSTKAGLGVVEPQLRNAIRAEPAILDGIDALVSTIDRIRAGK
jgi:hypothetical protein